MRAGVHHRVGYKVVWKIWIVGVTVEGELQDPRPRHLKLITQRHHIRRDYPQIFGDERQAAQLTLHHPEKSLAGTGHPLPGLGCWCPGWNVPRRGKTSEVIESNHIYMG